ncbi:hypothetical protein niasHT_008884 [Heterodera trifolii]|uniref:Uncharacterized protein n=1 Tax=Heterodera trifolii TaxID=157864 RepID=A0ABD2LYE5_9BILA
MEWAGSRYIALNSADPSPLFHRPGGADPLSSADPLFPLPRVSLRRRGPPLPTAPRAPPSSFCRPSARTPSLYCRGALSDGADPLSLLRRGPLPTIPSSVRADPPLFHGPLSLHCRGALSDGADPLSLLRRGPLRTIPSSVRADPLSSTDPSLFTAAGPSPTARTPSPYCAAGPSPPFRRPSARTPSLHRCGPPLSTAAREFCCASLGVREGEGRRESTAQNGARGKILLPLGLEGGGMTARKI